MPMVGLGAEKPTEKAKMGKCGGWGGTKSDEFSLRNSHLEE